MQKFEHKVVGHSCGSSGTEQAMEKVINRYTNEGWEFVSLAASDDPHSGITTFWVVFRAQAK